ncbi:hypothetical protein BDP27DRAFT_1417237 [Rhodocollybia butyracea]|uniref:Uncharacterized protein n=1 Tax=Rhodocollybia butyracea TaxID=206335 RepID=A0A9P5Q0T4_9AGAR|nr:hypothetical protein BDP27DRAFT_1417237 [Rhodocollybia butyracea]
MAGDPLTVSVTDTQVATCGRCKEAIVGQHLFVKAKGVSRRVCEACHKYYQEKKKNASGPSGSSQLFTQLTTNNNNIRQNVNQAQRGEFNGHVKAVSVRMPMAPPANVPSAIKIPFPEGLRTQIDGCTGYSDAHSLYKQCQQFYHEKAMSPGNTELVTLQATLSHLSGSKFKAVGDVTVIILNINIHVGCQDLYSILYLYLFPKWLKHSQNVALVQNDTILANDKHAEILPRVPDIDAIR